VTELTRQQRSVVEAPLAPLLVVAGAGSGKTATMAARVVHLVASGQVAPGQVLGLTFTRKAATELGARVTRRLAELGVDTGDGEPTVCTYHSYAAALLAEHAVRDGAEPDALLATPAVCWQLAARAVAEYAGPMDAISQQPGWVIDAVLRLAGELAEHLVSPEELLAHAARVRAAAATARPCRPLRELLTALDARQQLLPLVAAYHDLKRRRGFIDYPDQVALAAKLAAGHPEVGRLERDRYRVVLLDEYQDTGHAQRVLLRALFGGGHPVTAVGDPSQSIYGWRGASPGGLRTFPTDFPDRDGHPAATLSLATSFRNAPAILDLANRLAEPLRASGAATPLLSAARDEPAGRVVVALHRTLTDEAEWLAQLLAGEVRAGRRPAQIAVLVRRRAQMAPLREAIAARGLPVEVVGLGGLLDVPEVADVVALLRAVADPAPGPSIARLLTGPRWRLGPRDLAALGRRAGRLAGRDGGGGADRLDAVVAGDAGSLAEALDNPGEEGYSAEGLRRVRDAGAVLRRLRRRLDAPLPDLVAEAAAELRLDVELAASPADPAAARADLDAFVDVAAQFAAQPGSVSVTAFLAYLAAAADEEFGLEPAPVGAADTVKLLTVHAAKGLEWPVVAVPGLVDGGFPARSRGGVAWTRCAPALPFELRGDAADLPRLAGVDRPDLNRFLDAVAARERLEEDRLAYVAVTRAAESLICSGYRWGGGKRPVEPSPYLLAARAGQVELAGWADPPGDGVTNPLTAPAEVAWPAEPPVPAAAREAAALVAAARTAGPQAPSRWAPEVDLLLGEWSGAAAAPTAILGAELSVSDLVALRRDAGGFARAVRRPLPRRPAPAARRGSRFHRWLESLFATSRLIDLDDLPGAADAGPLDPTEAELTALQDAFRASEWWGRTPERVEEPFEMPLGGMLVRGRIDAVYREPGGGYSVVDWKTGTIPAEEDPAAAVQLAAYRAAWARLAGCPPERIRAGFHYVAAGRTVWLHELAGPDELARLVEALPVQG
jgi:DNA helicase-2/ATP-dependent DNA helicase PcrA